MALSASQGSKSPPVSQGETGFGDGSGHWERWLSKLPEGRGNCDESLGKPHPDKDVALRMFAISSSRCQSSLPAAFYPRADFPSGLTCWEEKKLRMGSDSCEDSTEIGSCSYKNREKVYFSVRVAWSKCDGTGSQKTWVPV